MSIIHGWTISLLSGELARINYRFYAGEHDRKYALEPLTASWRLQSCLGSSLTRNMLADILSSCEIIQNDLSKVSTQYLVNKITDLVAVGVLIVTILARPAFSPVVTATETPIKQNQIYKEPKDYIHITIFEQQTKQPVGNVLMSILLPNGTEAKRATNSKGEIFIDKVERGCFNITSQLGSRQLHETLAITKGDNNPSLIEAKNSENNDDKQTAKQQSREFIGQPRAIVDIDKHKVKSGDSLNSLAKQCDLTIAQLAYYNWGTYDSEQINDHLNIDVGCSKKADDNRSYIFDDSDEPGIIYLPKAWSKSGLATNQMHIFYVQRIKGPVKPFGLCKDNAGSPIAGKPFVIFENGVEVFSGETDEDGIINTPFPHDERYEVWWQKPGINKNQEAA